MEYLFIVTMVILTIATLSLTAIGVIFLVTNAWKVGYFRGRTEAFMEMENRRPKVIEDDCPEAEVVAEYIEYDILTQPLL